MRIHANKKNDKNGNDATCQMTNTHWSLKGTFPMIMDDGVMQPVGVGETSIFVEIIKNINYLFKKECFF